MNPSDQALNSGLSAPQINALIALRAENTRTVAGLIDEDERRLSEAIGRARRNERVRVKLCLYLNMRYEALWGGEPAIRAGVDRELRADYDARFLKVAAVA